MALDSGSGKAVEVSVVFCSAYASLSLLPGQHPLRTAGHVVHERHSGRQPATGVVTVPGAHTHPTPHQTRPVGMESVVDCGRDVREWVIDIAARTGNVIGRERGADYLKQATRGITHLGVDIGKVNGVRIASGFGLHLIQYLAE